MSDASATVTAVDDDGDDWMQLPPSIGPYSSLLCSFSATTTIAAIVFLATKLVFRLSVGV